VRGLAFAVIGAPSADVEFAAEVGLSHLGARTSLQCIKDMSLLCVMEVLDGLVYVVIVYSFAHMYLLLLCWSTVVAVLALFCTVRVGRCRANSLLHLLGFAVDVLLLLLMCRDTNNETTTNQPEEATEQPVEPSPDGQSNGTSLDTNRRRDDER
jgi:hypothetical protein